MIFEKNDINLRLEQFSSGEKQIINTLFILLKNTYPESSSITYENDIYDYREIIDGYNKIFFDTFNEQKIGFYEEIEAGLHPNWQKKILNLLKDATEGISQRFITTHSPIVCYSLNPETDILINMKEKGELISFNNYYSIDEFVEKSLKFNHLDISDEYSVWVEGESDKLYFNIAKKNMKKITPFSIKANKHSENINGLKNLSGSGFVLYRLLKLFLASEEYKNINKPLVAILDGDVLKTEENNFKKHLEKMKSLIKEEEEIIKNEKFAKIFKFKNDSNKFFYIFILKYESVEFYLDSKDKNFKNEINKFLEKKEKDVKVKIEKKIFENKDILETKKLEEILQEIHKIVN